MASRPGFVVMGYASPEARSKTRKRMADFAERLGEVTGIEVAPTPLSSYDRLAQNIHRGDIDLAWLPPISLVSLARNKSVLPLLSLRRNRLIHYRCALIVSSGSFVSAFEELRGKRAAWVDRHSASGYVLPRIELAAHGIRPGDIASERMFGSHDGVVRAIASGRADFGATYAHVDDRGMVTGPWSRTPGLTRSVRVMSVFGEVPPDAIAARIDLAPKLRDALAAGLRAMAKTDEGRDAIRDAFGAEDFEPPTRASYEPLRKTVFRAFESGLLEAKVEADDAVLGVAATIEHRAVRVKHSPDATDEADVIEVVEIERPRGRRR